MSPVDALAATIETAQRLDSEGRCEDAKFTLSQALTSAGVNKRGLLGKARKASKANRHHEVATCFAELSGSCPSLGDVELLERLAADYPEDTHIRQALAAALCGAGRRAEGIAEYEECVRMNTVDGRALAALAAEYAALGRRDEALDRYRRALDCLLHDHLTESACDVARGIAALAPASLESALRVVDLARGRDPAALAADLERYAVLCHTAGKMAQEADAWRELLALEPERADARRELAGTYTRILDCDPGDVDAWRGLEATDPGLAAELHVLLMGVSDDQSNGEVGFG